MASYGDTPGDRARTTKERADCLDDNEIIMVDRYGPRILRMLVVNPAFLLDRETLMKINQGRYAHGPGKGRPFLASRLVSYPEITVQKNGVYSMTKKSWNPDDEDPAPFTFQTLHVGTGEAGKLGLDRDIDDLVFYSVSDDELPSYHIWRQEKLVRREYSTEWEDPNENAETSKDPSGNSMATKDRIDKLFAKCYADIEKDIVNDQENLLRRKPDITPVDPDWEEIEEYFKWILDKEKKQNGGPNILRIIRDEFRDFQQLLLIPAADSSWRAKIQEENARKYEEALNTTFKGKDDNTITKFAMLCFSLPISPLTLTNIEHAGSADDIPGKVAGDNIRPSVRMIERTMRSEKPLKFLDSYHERSYGYPMIRTRKRQYEISVPAEQIPSHGQNTTHIPTKKRRMESQGFRCRYQQLSETLHLRGGSGSLPTADEPPEMAWIHSEMGRFSFVNNYAGFRQTATRLLHTNREKINFNIDMIREASNTFSSNKTAHGTGETCLWSQLREENYHERLKPKLSGPDKDRWIIRVRRGGDIKDPWVQPGNTIKLALADGDGSVAYWYLPLDTSPVIGTNPTDESHIFGTNQYQDTFRSAIECIIPNHRQHTVNWSLGDSETIHGPMVLAADAPSKELWQATLAAVKNEQGSKKPRPVRIHFELIPKKRDELRVIMPGLNKIGLCPMPNPGSAFDKKLFRKIRALIRERTKHLKHPVHIRIRSSPQNYAPDPDRAELNETNPFSGILVASATNEADQEVWLRGGPMWTQDAVVVRPEFASFTIIDNLKNKDTVPWPEQEKDELDDNDWSLSSFRKALKRLWRGYDPSKEYVGIVQPLSNNTFIIGREMTEWQWRYEVFDWLDNDQILVQRRLGKGLEYTRHVINSPLGPTFSKAVSKVIDPTVARSRMPGPKTGSKPDRDKGPREVSQTGSGPIGPDATGATSHEWRQYLMKQKVQDELRLDAFTTNPSIYPRHGDPQIPIHSQPHEPSISTGPSFPAVYTTTMTPTEVANLQRAYRQLQNIVLGRQEYCQMCNANLGSGPHNTEAKALHLQEHVNALRRAEKQASEHIVNSGLGQPREDFYCEFCGKTFSELEEMEKGSGAEHGSKCAKKAWLNHPVPQFCQYCRLNFWQSGLSPATVETHLADCTRRRLVTPQSQINLYQQLLNRSTGQGGQTTGAYACHFQGCHHRFTCRTTNATIAIHFWQHIHNNGMERVPCQYPRCEEDLAGFNNEQIMAHQGTHYPTNRKGGSRLRKICHYQNCGKDLTDLRLMERNAHIETHAYSNSQCHLCLENVSHLPDDQILEHYLTQHTYVRCHWHGCAYRYPDHSTEHQKREHLRVHVYEDLQEPARQPPLPEEEDLNYIPDRLKNSHKGLNFWCPRCYGKVSGTSITPCKKHRVVCGVQGHDSWLIMSEKDMRTLKTKGPAPKNARTDMRGAGTKEIGTKGGRTKVTGTKGSGAEEAVAKGAGAKGTGTKGIGAKGAGTKGAGTEGAGTEEAGAKEAGTKGTGTEEAPRKSNRKRNNPANKKEEEQAEEKDKGSEQAGAGDGEPSPKKRRKA